MPREHWNVVVMLTDQQRGDFSKADGFPLDVTPAIDRLGREGVRFNRAYTSTPICMPARISLWTGRFPSAHGIRGNFAGTAGLHYTADFLDVLKPTPYETLLVGKNHSHMPPQRFHYARLFDHDGASFFGPTCQPRPGREKQDRDYNRWMATLNHWISEVPTPFPLDCQYPVRIVNEAITYLEHLGREPFFLWLSFPEPHSPYQVPAPYWDMFPPDEVPERFAGQEALRQKGYRWEFEHELIERFHPDFDRLWRRYRSNYCGLIRMVDDQIDRFMEFLNQRGLRDRTIVVFLSDHGDYAGDYGLVGKGCGVPECLVRVPMAWTGPGIAPREAMHEAHVSIVDVLPTLCDALGIPVPEGVQGRSLWPILTGGAYDKAEFSSVYVEHGYGSTDSVPGARCTDHPLCAVRLRSPNPTFSELNHVTQSGKRRMVRRGDWKLTVELDSGGELYNVVDDPGELHNRFNEPSLRELQAELMQELMRWMMRVDDAVPLSRFPNLSELTLGPAFDDA